MCVRMKTIVKSTSLSCISYKEMDSEHACIGIFHRSTLPRSLVPLLKTGQTRLRCQQCLGHHWVCMCCLQSSGTDFES